MKATHLPSNPGPAAWDAILPPGRRYPKLEDNLKADWLIVGAGFAGLSAARRLRQIHPTDSITLLEAKKIGEGPIGRNSGFMIDLPHNLVSEDYAGGLEKDRVEAVENRAAISFAEEAAREFDFSPDTLARSGKINAAATEKGTEHNRAYAAHLSKMGEDHVLLDAAQMAEVSGSEYYQSGLFTPGTAMLQPASFARETAEGLIAQAVAIFEDSPVVALDRTGGVWIAKTSKGSIEAPKILLTINGHLESFGLFKRRLMHVYLYGSMTRPLTIEENRRLGGETVWGFTPADPMGTTVRKISTPEGPRIVIRNGVTWSPSRKATSRDVEKMGRAHDRSFLARFPMLQDVEAAYRWGGLLCLSRNGTSAFGEVEPGLFAAGCQNGLGAARGTFSGMMIAELASEHSSENLTRFQNQAPPSSLPIEPLATIGAKATLKWGEYKAGREL